MGTDLERTAGALKWGTTAEDGEDSGGATGWSIGNNGKQYVGGAGIWFDLTGNATYRFRLHDVVGINITQVEVTSEPKAGLASLEKKYGAGEKIQVTVTFGTAMTVTGDPVFKIKMGNAVDTPVEKDAVYVRGSGTTALVFEYTILVGDEDDDGILIEAGALTLDADDRIQDSNSDDALLSHSALGDLSGHKVDSSLRIYTAPTALNGQVEMKEDVGYTFAASDFNFSDVDPGDTLASVKIETLPESGKGTLKFDGAALTSSDLPKTVTKAELDGNKLVYESPTDENGNGYASFTFKVNDGTYDSDSDYTMTMNIDAVPDITRVAVTSEPRSGSSPKKYGAGEKIEVTVTFDEVVNVTGDPVFEIKMGNSGGSVTMRNADYVEGTGTQDLIFQYTVIAADQDDNGIGIGANALTLDADDRIQDADSDNADVTHAQLSAQSRHQVDGSQTPPTDTTAPLFSSATVDSTSLVITFDENLAAAVNLANGAFTVKKTSGGSTETVALSSTSPPSISNSTVTLKLESAVLRADTVTVSYTQPGSGIHNKLKDAANNEVASFTDQDVANNTPLPILVSNMEQSSESFLLGSHNSQEYDIAQEFTTGGHAAGYTLTSVELTLYPDSSTGVPTVKVVSGSARGTTLATLSGPASLEANTAKDYTFRASGAITLNPSTRYWMVFEGLGEGGIDTARTVDEDSESLSGWSIKDHAQGRLASSTGAFDNYSSNTIIVMGLRGSLNVSSDTTAPVLSSAEVNGTSLVITFDEDLAAAANLANGAFTVKRTSGGVRRLSL